MFVGEYSIADMAILPWALRHEWQQIQLEDYPYVKEYVDRLTAARWCKKHWLFKFKQRAWKHALFN